MIWIRGLVEVGRMTRRAILRRSGVLAVYVTLRARHVHMRSRQRERRHGAVIERRPRPLHGRVARFATCRESR